MELSLQSLTLQKRMFILHVQSIQLNKYLSKN